MKYVKQQITEFTETNLTDIYNDWSPTTTYTFESGTPTNASVVRYGTYYYRSLVDGNTNYNPEEYENVKWVKYGISNKWAMLDLSAQSKSTYSGNLYVKLEQGKINTLAFGNYEAEHVSIEILDTDGTTVLWTYDTPGLVNQDVTDWWTYIYSDYNYESDRATVVRLPIKGSYIKVTFIKPPEPDNAACGFLVGGESVDMGATLADVNFGFNSFAIKEADEWGALQITKRAVQDLVDFETIIPTVEVHSFKRKVKSVYNDIILFILDDDTMIGNENLLTLGVIQDSNVVLSEFDKTILTFSIMESV